MTQQSPTDWLRQALSAGAVGSAYIKELAEQAGLGPKALRNAREKLGVVATRHGQASTMHSVWTLPDPGSDAVEGLSCLGTSTTSLSTSVKVSDRVDDHRKPVVSTGHVARERVSDGLDRRDAACSEMMTFVDVAPKRSTGAVADQLLRIAMGSAASTSADLTVAEVANAERRTRQFVDRGMDSDRTRELAIKLVVERDRAGSKAGSCIECQYLDRSSCAPGAAAHTPGPRNPSEIWMCWTARRP